MGGLMTRGAGNGATAGKIGIVEQGFTQGEFRGTGRIEPGMGRLREWSRAELENSVDAGWYRLPMPVEAAESLAPCQAWPWHRREGAQIRRVAIA